MSTDLIEVVVAPGHSIVDATGAQIPASGIAQVLLSDIPSLVQNGFIASPSRPESPSDSTLSWSLYTAVQSALYVASALRPGLSGSAQLAQQLATYGAKIGNYASQLLTLINDGKVGGS